VSVYTFSDETKRIPARRGFALRDAMESSLRHGGTRLGAALDSIKDDFDRIVVVTDEQSHDRVPAPKGRGYMINVASAKNGVGYGAWAHIDGWSEAVIEYIRELERSKAD
jgi:60 kDa SS-A/Ro ribonucleoprotein